MVSFDVRICLLLIKAYSREKPEREKERGCIESVVPRKQNARLILERRRRRRYILRKMLARISMPLCRYSYQLSLQLYLSQRSSTHRNTRALCEKIDRRKTRFLSNYRSSFFDVLSFDEIRNCCIRQKLRARRKSLARNVTMPAPSVSAFSSILS